MMNTTDYENIWQKSLIHVTDEFALPPVVLQAGEAIIGTLGNFSVSTGKAKAKKTFNVSAHRCSSPCQWAGAGISGIIS